MLKPSIDFQVPAKEFWPAVSVKVCEPGLVQVPCCVL
jgi:hypothetical protein